nr:uncharacterized protein LOC127340347 [Lolium perenne]
MQLSSSKLRVRPRSSCIAARLHCSSNLYCATRPAPPAYLELPAPPFPQQQALHLPAAPSASTCTNSSGARIPCTLRPPAVVRFPLRPARPPAASAAATSGCYGLRGRLQLPPHPARPPAASATAPRPPPASPATAFYGCAVTAAPDHAPFGSASTRLHRVPHTLPARPCVNIVRLRPMHATAGSPDLRPLRLVHVATQRPSPASAAPSAPPAAPTSLAPLPPSARRSATATWLP